MTTSRLQLYNGALVNHLGQRPLASLTENQPSRRYLDTAWNNDAVKWCLEQGQWKFAMRSAQVDYSPSVEPGFPGLQYAFNLPDDHVRLAGVFQDQTMKVPYLDYRVEAGFMWGNLETMYIRYVSDDEDYGGDFSLWPQSFVELVEIHLAAKVAKPLTQDDNLQDKLEAKRDKRVLLIAKSHDAMEDPTRFPATGSWVKSRFSGQRYRRAGDR